MKSLSLLLTLLCSLIFSAEEWVYTTEKGSQKFKTTWSVADKGKDLIVTAKNDFSTTTLDCSKTYQFHTFKVDSKHDDESYTAELKDKHLIAHKTKGGQPLHKEYKLDQPWIQEFGYGLKPFAEGADKSFKFVILNPDSLDLNKMIAIKEGEETLKIEGHELKAQKIKITLQGFKHVFWKGYVWFDPKTNTLVKYSGNEGPNTPTTTITLTELKKTLSL